MAPTYKFGLGQEYQKYSIYSSDNDTTQNFFWLFLFT
jgi:hypothetical protein